VLAKQTSKIIAVVSVALMAVIEHQVCLQ